MTEYCTIITTAPTELEAEKISKLLLDEKVVACVQHISIKSSYRWQGKIEHSPEVMLVMKTQKKHYDKVEKLIKENHSYQTPEIIMLPVETGFADYLEWIKTETVHG